MELKASQIAEKCLEKGIAFCLYQFPDSHEIKIALPEEFCCDKSGNSFVITPFPIQSRMSEIHLRVVSMPLSTEDWEKIGASNNYSFSLPKVPNQETKEEYFEKINRYLDAFKMTELQKAILSRVIHLPKTKNWNPFQIFQRLCENYSNTFVSCFFSRDSGLWLGATPELLISTSENKIETVALAGTQPRKEDSNYSWREKEMEEHKFVRQHIENIFLKNGCILEKSNGPYTIEAARVAHLKTDYTFISPSTIDLVKLLSDLHPTPAIGGLPVKAALACISNVEQYSRNYYTGYIGEINGMQATRLYINLRCMQVDDQHIALYVGGGISADSDPEEEWQETIQKSLTLRQIVEEV